MQEANKTELRRDGFDALLAEADKREREGADCRFDLRIKGANVVVRVYRIVELEDGSADNVQIGSFWFAERPSVAVAHALLFTIYWMEKLNDAAPNAADARGEELVKALGEDIADQAASGKEVAA